MDKKGSLQDVIFIAGVMLVISISLLVGFKMTDSFNEQVQGLDIVPDDAKESMAQFNGYYPSVMDSAVLFVLVGLIIVALIFAFLIRVHPVFIVFYLILLVVIVFISAIFSNIYEQVSQDPNMIAQASQLTFTSNIMNFLPFIIGIVGFIIAIVMFKQGGER